ncbi:MAG: EI24 domain-containing protein [Pseudomonadota bacterium]
MAPAGGGAGPGPDAGSGDAGTAPRYSGGLADDVSRAVGQMGDPRFLGVLARALGLTVGLLVGLGALIYAALGLLPETMDLWLLGEVPTPVSWIRGAAVLGLLAASSFLMIPVAAAVVGLFADRIVAAVDGRWYPDRRGAATRPLAEQLGEALRTLLVVLAINLLALVLLLVTGPLAPFLFYALNGYILGREFFESVAAHYMGVGAARALRKKHGFRVWLAGTVMAVPLTIPIMNLLIPVLGTAAFTHMVQRLRAPGPTA